MAGNNAGSNAAINPIPGLTTCIHEATQTCLSQLDPAVDYPLRTIRDQMLLWTQTEVEAANVTHKNNGKLSSRKVPTPKELNAWQVAQIIMFKFDVGVLKYGDDNEAISNLIGIYDPDEGIYIADRDDRTLGKIVLQLTANSSKTMLEDVSRAIRNEAPLLHVNTDPDVIAVNNGIFNFRTKELMPFSKKDPKYVFTSKSPVNYVDNPVNPVIHNDDDGTDWDVESWMQELSDDPEIVNVLWEVIGAVIRPGNDFGKAAFFYNTAGNNGKGCLCQLMRNLCGEKNTASVSLEQFGDQFAPGQLIGKSANIVDECNVGEYLEAAAKFKSAVTHDVFEMRLMRKDPFPFRFLGQMVLCVNQLPKVRDKTGSFARRILGIPFGHCFTGRERKYIKSDYIYRKEVLEYVLWRVLNMNYNKFSEPAACKQMVAELQTQNDSVLAFLEFFFDRIVPWNFYPFGFLYDAYAAWFQNENPGAGKRGLVSSQTFATQVRERIGKFDGWEVAAGADGHPKQKRITKADRICERPEYIIADLKLGKYANNVYPNTVWYCKPTMSAFGNANARHRGISRINPLTDAEYTALINAERAEQSIADKTDI